MRERTEFIFFPFSCRRLDLIRKDVVVGDVDGGGGGLEKISVWENASSVNFVSSMCAIEGERDCTSICSKTLKNTRKHSNTNMNRK